MLDGNGLAHTRVWIQGLYPQNLPILGITLESLDIYYVAKCNLLSPRIPDLTTQTYLISTMSSTCVEVIIHAEFSCTSSCRESGFSLISWGSISYVIVHTCDRVTLMPKIVEVGDLRFMQISSPDSTQGNGTNTHLLGLQRLLMYQNIATAGK